MQLRTFTSLWKVERRLYKFYDIALPYPVSLKQLGIFLGVGVPWVALLAIVGFPLETPWHVVWIAPPVVATIVGNRPVAEGKTLWQWLRTQIGFVFTARDLARLAPAPAPRSHRVTARTWARTSD